MTTFIDLDADNVVGISVDGKISTQEFEAIATLLKKKMKDHAKIRIYVEVVSFKGITLKGLMEDLKFGLESWDRFDKEAVVTEKKWIQKWSEIAGGIIESVQVKAFPLEEKEMAKKWIQE